VCDLIKLIMIYLLRVEPKKSGDDFFCLCMCVNLQDSNQNKMIKYDFNIQGLLSQSRVSAVASFIIFMAATQNVDKMKYFTSYLALSH
jgi:hypothetical protein